jgi:MFS family permease
MQTTVVLWLAFELTHQSKWPSLIVAAGVLPTFLLGPWSGRLADRLPKRWLIFFTQAVYAALAFLLAGLVFFRAVTVWQLLVVTAVSGLVTAVDLPARLAFVIDMVGREDLMNAVALNSLLFNVARALGPAVGGVMFLWLGDWPCFLINGLSYLAVLWALAQMDISGDPPSRSSKDKPRSDSSAFAYLVRHRELAFLTLLAGTVALCGWPSQALLPAFAAHVLEAHAQQYTLMLTATGLGALIAAWVVATFGSIELRGRLIALGVTFVTLSLLGLSLSGNVWPAILFCGLVGFGLILVLSTGQSVIQLGAAENNRGQIMGIWAMVLCGAVPLGNLVAGPAADLWSERAVLAVLGVVCGATVLLLFGLLRPWNLLPEVSRPITDASDGVYARHDDHTHGT